MSWLGVKYALACRDERVKGGTRLTLVALGVRVEYRHVTTSPTSLGELHWLTFLSPEQLRRNLDDLESWGKVVRVSRGKNAVYGLPEMAGPLFAVDPGDPVKMTDFLIDGLPKEIGRNARKVTRRMTDFAGRRAGGVLFSEVLGTEVPATTGENPKVAGFLDWFAAEFRARRNVAYRVNREKAARYVVELLAEGRSVERLKAMAVLMFEAERDAFILGSDYSVFVLAHKATYLEAIVERNEQDLVRRAAR